MSIQYPSLKTSIPDHFQPSVQNPKIPYVGPILVYTACIDLHICTIRNIEQTCIQPSFEQVHKHIIVSYSERSQYAILDPNEFKFEVIEW